MSVGFIQKVYYPDWLANVVLVIADKITKLASSEERLTSIGLEMEVQKHPNIEEVPTFAIQSTSS